MILFMMKLRRCLRLLKVKANKKTRTVTISSDTPMYITYLKGLDFIMLIATDNMHSQGFQKLNDTLEMASILLHAKTHVLELKGEDNGKMA